MGKFSIIQKKKNKLYKNNLLEKITKEIEFLEDQVRLDEKRQMNSLQPSSKQLLQQHSQ